MMGYRLYVKVKLLIIKKSVISNVYLATKLHLIACYVKVRKPEIPHHNVIVGLDIIKIKKLKFVNSV